MNKQPIRTPIPCELAEHDQLLLKLAEQVDRISERLDRLELQNLATPAINVAADDRGAPCCGVSRRRISDREEENGDRAVRATRPPLPDPRLVRRIIRQRRLRVRFFDGELFADPAWDMLLDLAAARAEHTRVSVTSLCIASGVPPTTALRWIGQLVDAGLFERIEDETDRRRAFISLTDKGADAMARYFAELGRDASQLL